MDCGTARERAVAWLEGELGRAEAGQVEAHVERCPRCADHIAALDAQRPALRALRAAGEAAASPPPEGWARMDAALDVAFSASEAARAAAAAPVPAPRRWALSPWGALAYTAALLLALGWGWWQRQAAAEARTQLAEVQATLEREQRLGAGGAAPALGAVPALAVPAGSLQPAAYTPQRSTF